MYSMSAQLLFLVFCFFAVVPKWPIVIFCSFRPIFVGAIFKSIVRQSRGLAYAFQCLPRSVFYALPGMLNCVVVIISLD